MRFSSGSVRSATSIGLDIGSRAVRAAEVSRGRKGLSLRRFAQVGLPPGAVVGGEIVNGGLVTEAVRRLWSSGDFGSRRVVLSLSGKRVIVRRAEVLTMSEGDFRSALTFQATDLIPIPIDDAQLDFIVLPPVGEAPKRREHMDIVLAAAHRRQLRGHLSVLRDASITVVAIDPAPMAAARVADRFQGPNGADPVAVVDVGADLTVITVVEAGSVRFSRILDIGGVSLTTRLAERHAIGEAEAESMKRSGDGTESGSPVLVEDLVPLVSEIESSLAFFGTQLSGSPIAEVLLTGGAARDEVLVGELTRRIPAPLRLLDPLDGVDCGDLNLDEEGRRSASATCLLAVGTAEWAWESSSRRVSLLPKEVAAAAQARRQIALATAGLVVVAGGLTYVSLQRSERVHREQKDVSTVVARNAALEGRVETFGPVEATTSAIEQRLQVVASADAGNVNWTALLDDISRAMPKRLRLSAVSFSGPGGSSGSADSSGTGSSGDGSSSLSASGDTAGVSGPLGSVTMTVTGAGTEEDVAVWMRAFRHVPGLEGVTIASAEASNGSVSFTSTGGITRKAPMIKRPSGGG